MDSYDRPGALATLALDSDEFKGTDRKTAKLSIVSGAFEDFSTVEELYASLEDDDDMIQRDPPIKRAATSRRVSEEQRNVSVDAVLAAASREEDNDFHLIICDDPEAPVTDRFCLNVEVSGLPAGGAFKGRLQKARDQFKTLLGGQLPGERYVFYEPAIPVTVSGSLFYDISHKPGAVGPQALRPRTAWEIHPITGITERPETTFLRWLR